MKKTLAASGDRKTAAATPTAIDISGMDDNYKSMRKHMPAHARAAYDENWAKKKKVDPADLTPRKNPTGPARHMPDPPAPKGNTGPAAHAGSRPSGFDAVFEAWVGRLPLGNVTAAERSRIYGEMEQAILTA